jgi:hypothetical protein
MQVADGSKGLRRWFVLHQAKVTAIFGCISNEGCVTTKCGEIPEWFFVYGTMRGFVSLEDNNFRQSGAAEIFELFVVLFCAPIPPLVSNKIAVVAPVQTGSVVGRSGPRALLDLVG